MAINPVRFVIRKKKIPAKEKWVLVCLANHYSAISGKCEPGIPQLMLDTCLSKSSVKRELSVLEAGGHIEVERSRGKGCKNQYTIIGMGGKDAKGEIRPNQKAEYMFETFWKLYPKKVEKKRARTAFLALKCDQKLYKSIVDDLRLRLKGQWKNKELKFVLNPTTYIHGERWNDEIEVIKEELRGPVT